MQLCNISVLQALNLHSTHRTKHHAFILCQNIAVPTTSLYHTVFPMQESLNKLLCKLLQHTCSFHAYSVQFATFCGIFYCNFSHKIAAMFHNITVLKYFRCNFLQGLDNGH